MSHAPSTEEVKHAYLEWIVKVCEVFCQARCEAPSLSSDPKISRHFALSLPERFDIRPTVYQAESRGFFESSCLALTLKDRTSNIPGERIVFTFYPVKDLPPQFREERKSVTLLRRLSVAIRVLFSVSRLMPTFWGERSAISYSIDFPVSLDEISDSTKLELFSLGSHVGILKVLVEWSPRKTAVSAVAVPAAVVQIDEEYVRGKVASTELVVSSVPPRMTTIPMIGNSFVFTRSEGSSPGSASRDLLLDVWPAVAGAGRKSSGGSHTGMFALGGPESLSSEDGNFFHDGSQAESSSSDATLEKDDDVGNFFVNGENFEAEPTPSLGDLLLFARHVKIRKFKHVLISDIPLRIKALEEVDKHLKLLK